MNGNLIIYEYNNSNEYNQVLKDIYYLLKN